MKVTKNNKRSVKGKYYYTIDTEDSIVHTDLCITCNDNNILTKYPIWLRGEPYATQIRELGFSWSDDLYAGIPKDKHPVVNIIEADLCRKQLNHLQEMRESMEAYIIELNTHIKRNREMQADCITKLKELRSTKS